MFGLCLLLFQTAAYADGDEKELEDLTEVEKVSTLSLDDVIERGLERNSMLLLLKYQMEITDNQKNDMILDLDNLNDDLDAAESSAGSLSSKMKQLNAGEAIKVMLQEIAILEEEIASLESELAEGDEESVALLEKQNEILEKELEKLEKAIAKGQIEETNSALQQGLSGIYAQIEALEDAIDQLELAIQKIKAGELQLAYEAKEAELMVKLMLTSAYTGLLSSQEQIELLQMAYGQVENDIEIMKIKVDLGLTSSYDLKKSERELEKQKKALEQAKQDYLRDLAKLALDIGIEFNPDIKLQQIKIDSKLADLQEENIEKLVESSFSYKKAQENLWLAELDLNDLKNKDDVSIYKINQAELAVKVEEEKIRQLKLDLKESIEDLYYNLERSYQNLADLKRDLGYTITDYDQLKIQYELGLLSASQYKQSGMQMKQGEFDLTMAELSYYVLNEQVKAIHEGLIQTQQ